MCTWVLNADVVIFDRLEKDFQKDDHFPSCRYSPVTMRRSIGVREAEPPRRLRQSQEFQGVRFLFLMVAIMKDIVSWMSPTPNYLLIICWDEICVYTFQEHRRLVLTMFDMSGWVGQREQAVKAKTITGSRHFIIRGVRRWTKTIFKSVKAACSTTAGDKS